MLEMTETPIKAPVVEKNALDEILPIIRELSAHDKLVLIRILADELANASSVPQPDPLLGMLPHGTVIEMYSPVEVNGSPEALEALVKMAS